MKGNCGTTIGVPSVLVEVNSGVSKACLVYKAVKIGIVPVYEAA